MLSSAKITGIVLGTGATISVECGGIPKAVRLLNISGLATLEWNENMSNGWGLKTVTDGTISLITSLGVTPGAVNTLRGFYIGADTDVNVDGEQIIYEAWW